MGQMKQLEISMDDELFAALERYAEEAGISKGEVVRRCLRAEFGPPPPPS
jgi:metal-responsive CopG/Arc/MetJ family transcriptional regulator